MRSAIVVGLLLSALLLSSVFISSCESETPFEPGDPPDSVGDDFTKIESVEEAQLIVASFDSLERHAYLSLDIWGNFPASYFEIDTTFSGYAAGTAHIFTKGRSFVFGGHCGSNDHVWGAFDFDLTNYDELGTTVLNNSGLIKYNALGNFNSGVCEGRLKGRGYSRSDTLTITSPQLSVEYKYNGTEIRDEIEVRAVYIHTFNQLLPYQAPSVTLDSTVTRKYYLKSSNGNTFEW